MMMPFFGPSIIILIPAIIFATYAQTKIKTTFNKYTKVKNSTGYTGAEIARKILDRNGLQDIAIEHVRGSLTDHYDPRKKVLRLSDTVYNDTSVAASGVAAHEVGHAIQHAKGYFPLTLRNTIAPVASFGSRFVWLLIIGGFLLGEAGTGLINIGILLYTGVVIFQIVTLPVEFNASNRALMQLEEGIIAMDEIEPAKKVLNAAALTYVAATLVAVAQLIRLLLLRRD